MRLTLSALLLLSTLAGCASGPAVSSTLPVRRVVLYRNGVGYFERGGTFRGHELAFGVRQREVGDFLASLTAIERTAGGVRSVSFEVPEPIALPVTPVLPGASAPAVPPVDPAGPRMDVRLRLAGDDTHDLTVAYVVSAPIWRPSYRVVIDEHDALLQAWAVVQNTSGEDWRDVQLSLTTGSPISFRSDLGTPVTPQRPMVTDTGEVVAAVPLSETALAQGGVDEGQLASVDGETMASAGDALGPMPSMPTGGAAAGRAPRAMSRMQMAQTAPTPPPQEMNAAALQRSVRSMAAVAVLGEGVTRYDLDGTVTVPNGGSTMVAVLSARVPGAAVHLFAPDGGVPLSYQHPFRVVRIENRTRAILERGPISVFGSDAFLGQGLLEPLPRGATAFVPFAVDRSVVVETSQEYGEQEGRLVRVTRGQVIVERFSERTTHYHVRNGGDEATKVYVRHARLDGSDLVHPPEGAELTPGNALLPTTVPARGEVDLAVVERTPVQRTVDFMTSVAADAVGLYLSGPAVNLAQGQALRRALELRAQLVAQQQRLEAAQAQRNEFTAAAAETRQNLDTVRQIASAADLRDRLVRRLAQLDQQMADTMRTLVDAQTSVSELQARLNEALQDVTLEVPPPAADHAH